MIEIPQPALVLNAENAPRPHYRMTNTGQVPTGKPVVELMEWINRIALSTPNRRLRSLILNCHGITDSNNQYGFGLDLGFGIFWFNVSSFNLIRNKVDVIYITACGAARVSSHPTIDGHGDGNFLMSSIARNANCMVLASTEAQLRPRSIPSNHIDNFEGQVLTYDRFGRVVASAVQRSVIHGGTFGVGHGDNG